jgi:hypothetical protein
LAVRSWRTVLAQAAAMIPLGVVLAEVFLALTPRPSVLDQRARLMARESSARGVEADRRSLYQVVMELRAAGQDSYPTFSPTQFILDPGKAWRPPFELNGRALLPLTSVARTKSVYCNETGRWLVFESDRYGFNNPDSTWDQPRTRTAIVGDSFAQGACVQPAESPAALLRVGDPTVLTVGVGGTGPLLQLAILKEFLAKRRPDRVFWFFYEGNDLHLNLQFEAVIPYLQRYLEPGFSHSLAEIAEAADRFLRTTIDAQFREPRAPVTGAKASDFSLSRSARLLTLREQLGLLSCPSRNQNFSLLHDIVAEGRRTVESWGGKLTMVYLPADPRGECDLFRVATRAGNWLHDGVLRAFEKSGVAIVDLRSAYLAMAAPPEFYAYPGAHFSAAGYRFLADALSRASAVAAGPNAPARR